MTGKTWGEHTTSVENTKTRMRRWMAKTQRGHRTASPGARLRGWSRWAGLLLLNTLGAAAIASRIPGPPIALPVRRVRLEQMQAQMRGGLASRLLVQDANAAVARFDGRAGIFRYDTVELIHFSDQGVTFEHLRGPFLSCIERFEFVPLADHAYVLEHRGTFVMRGGLLGWLFGVLAIRGVFDRLVASHMRNSSGATDSRSAQVPPETTHALLSQRHGCSSL
jgi:hypothetical protein